MGQILVEFKKGEPTKVTIIKRQKPARLPATNPTSQEHMAGVKISLLKR